MCDEKFNLLVLGDSIQWGQGLQLEDKIFSLCAASITKYSGREVQVHNFANSGARIWKDASTAPHPNDTAFGGGTYTKPGNASTRLFIGERPRVEPYLWAQLYEAAQQLDAKGVVPDLILLDGGINDVGVFEIANPLNSVDEMTDRVNNMQGFMRELLIEAHKKFPEAKLIVTGYYPIFSMRSFASILGRAATVAYVHAFHGIGLSPFEPLDHLADLSSAFATGINTVLRDDVAAFNQSSNQTLAACAIPAFGAANAYAAPSTLLWELKLDPFHFLEPEDDAIDARQDACGGATGVESLICHRASAGHPTPAGARRYHKAVFTALRGFHFV